MASTFTTNKSPYGEFTVEIRALGVGELVSAFEGLGVDLRTKVLTKAVRTVATKIMAAIVMMTPTGKTKDPGRLRRNIKLRIRRSQKTVRAGIVVNERGDKTNPSNAYYWDFVERGHRVRTGSKWGSDKHTYLRKTTRKSGGYAGSTGFVKGRFFISDAWLTYKDWALNHIVQSVEQAIDKHAAKQQRSAIIVTNK